jgi:BirA family biotin operon repressor/biotin-[acetyl-CoA-carboxylase] ligase
MAGDLSAQALARLLPDRPLRSYPALLSTEADALAWARAGAPEGAVVVADYQASPRGRGGLPWTVRAGAALGFSLVLRPHLARSREGWMYTVASSGVADALGAEATIEWPDAVHVAGGPAGAVGVHVELGPTATAWAVVNALIGEPAAPRGPLLARVLADYVARCDTLGRTVRARLLPLGPGGAEVAGRAARCLNDGALVIETPAGERIAVTPHSLGLLEAARGDDGAPAV